MPCSRYPTVPEGTLVIDRSWSYCGDCGLGAFAHQEAHQDEAGWNPSPGGGCGVKWVHVTSSYTGAEMKSAAMQIRPDLTWVDMFPGVHD